jgi:polyisoprenyl-phosphate glycosyltransferase
VSILVPVLDDWEAAGKLAGWIDRVAVGAGERWKLVFVDDGSSQPAPERLAAEVGGGVCDVTVVELLRNVGHQRAIALGLGWLAENRPGDVVAIMDGDGEDKPDDLPGLLSEARRREWGTIVFAERTRRSEGLVFRAGYLAFRVLHRLLTGKGVKYGNFSVVPPRLVARLAVTSEVWNHYAAAVTQSRMPMTTVPTVRGNRLAGRSKMNLPALVTHGLSALSVHGELVATRLLLITTVFSVVAFGIGVVVAAQRIFTDWPIPGWTSQLGTLAMILLVQAMTLSLVVSAVALMSRSGASFLPRRDYKWFIGGVRRLGVGEVRRPGAGADQSGL